MTRPHTLSAAVVLLTAATAHSQPPAPRVVGASGPGAQPQVGTGAYQGATPAARGVNPFVTPVALPTIPPGVRFTPRQGGAPPVFAPPPAPVVANNPAVFNPGMPQPFPVVIPPPVRVATGVSYNPLFVSRRGVVSAYYVPPISVRSPSLLAYPEDELYLPAESNPGPGLAPPPGDYRFLPWMW